jgi:putative ATPase
MGIVIASAAASAYEYIGLPEGVYPIVEATLYLSTAPKSNSAAAYFKALESIQSQGVGEVPAHLMDASRDGPGLGHGKGYQYPHDFPGHFTAQQYMPSGLMDQVFYQPSDQGYEASVSERLKRWRNAQRKSKMI